MTNPIPFAPEFTIEVAGTTLNHAGLTALFQSVQNAEHWKGPIHAVVPAGAFLPGIAAAVEFFTATEATFTPLASGATLVTAPGYWAGPAN